MIQSLIGYVSDEDYRALPDVSVEIQQSDHAIALARSSARGGIYLDLPAGNYEVSLSAPGYGAKKVDVEYVPGAVHQFRLLSDTMLGYVWPKWSRAGDQAEIRVHSVEPFRVSLWKYGRSKTQVGLIGWFDAHGPRAVMQITPDGDYTQTGVKWNTVGYGHVEDIESQYAVTAPEESGLYYFHVESQSGKTTSFPWIVAPRAPAARIAVLANTNTWNAYNSFGGRGNYVSGAGLPPAPTVNARQDLDRYKPGLTAWTPPDSEYVPLSFERPEMENVIPLDEEVTDPIRGRRGLASSEWRLLAWMEKQGLPYDYYSEYHLHSGQLELDRYTVLVVPVHPEYWSRQMYQKTKEWVFDRGGRLMYLGGNGLNCEVEVLDEFTIRFKTHMHKDHGSLGMPDPDEPDTFYESRFHRTFESEASLLGVVCTPSGMMTAAPYSVIDDAHWVFDGTGLKAGDDFGAESLEERCSGGASGRETDKMSPFSPAGTTLLAKGLNPDNGEAEMVIFETSTGGAVFSVGSITFVSSLLVDANISQITRNVLDAFLDPALGS